jgi:5-methylcytosine-specific restriction endonuclease McrA
MPRTDTDQYNGSFRDIVIYCMTEKGQDPNVCFECGDKLTEVTRQIHHLKYDGATIADLRFGCSRCNNQEKYQNIV